MKTVFVGLSGGVDSAVSAALLKEAGYTVVGCFIKIWQPEFIECTWKEDRLDAMRVCAALDIPFQEIDLSNEYGDEVIGDMIEGYKRGITPNPDILCNSRIKFGHFARWAFEHGADIIATGHYARIEKNEEEYRLLRGRDMNKDQSYFLWQLKRDDLKKILFPVGSLTKSEVRAHAARFSLPVAAKRDSQGLCFVGGITLPEFLRRYMRVEQGDLFNEQGKKIGMHEGAVLYTLGQRHGFTVKHAKSDEVPYFVIATDIVNNTITVSRDKMGAARTELTLHASNHLQAASKNTFRAEAQVRYREPAVAADFENIGDTMRVHLQEKKIAAPGQSLVMYEGERVLGGGIIE
ncbi:tRNA 2-thiouridine(34) synthase MnmA [Candidatus Kaiserbacteria bacterium]|nr:tRNA 2-thiouridine(34) synthase MnmA [Candidatus Kaiserbacteria bacterium]